MIINFPPNIILRTEYHIRTVTEHPPYLLPTVSGTCCESNCTSINNVYLSIFHLFLLGLTQIQRSLGNSIGYQLTWLLFLGGGCKSADVQMLMLLWKLLFCSCDRKWNPTCCPNLTHPVPYFVMYCPSLSSSFLFCFVLSCPSVYFFPPIGHDPGCFWPHMKQSHRDLFCTGSPNRQRTLSFYRSLCASVPGLGSVNPLLSHTPPPPFLSLSLFLSSLHLSPHCTRRGFPPVHPP